MADNVKNATCLLHQLYTRDASFKEQCFSLEQHTWDLYVLAWFNFPKSNTSASQGVVNVTLLFEEVTMKIGEGRVHLHGPQQSL